MRATSIFSNLKGATRSVFFRVTAIVAICTAAVAGTMTVLSSQGQIEAAERSTRELALNLTSFASSLSASAIRFANPEALNTIVLGAVNSSDGATLDAIVINNKGETIYTYGDKDLEGQSIQTLATVALQTQEVERTGDDFFVAVPARFGKNNDVVGVVAISWTPDVAISHVAAAQQKINIVAGVVFLVSLIVVTFLLRSTLSKPLVRLREAMDEVSHAHYDIEVPNLRRKDEIGDIARTLDDFRVTLAEAEATSRESLFKGAAFEASSSAMLMVDQDLTINYVNASFFDIMDENTSDLSGQLKGKDSKEIVGQSVSVFHDNPEEAQAVMGDDAKLPHVSDIAMGDTRVEQTISAVHDAAGKPIGRVVQWKDVTEDRLNQAIISSLDTNQARVEFAPDGALVHANENFLSAYGTDQEALLGRQCPDLFPENSKGAQGKTDFWSDLQAGQSIFGRFPCVNGAGEPLIFDGSFSPVTDRTGKVSRFVFIATDVSATQIEIQRAEELRKITEEQQSAVVDGLRVGLTQLSKGDLTFSIEKEFAQEYEQLRSDFNGAIDSLRAAMSSVVDNSDMIRGETNEISKAADDLSRRTETQAATLEETAAALDEMTSSVTSAADGAGMARQMVTEARDNAEASGEVVREAVEAMSEIASSSKQISKITSVIDDIAFQTNLLALNAGVEAARAGDAGRGFAVVATEVRDLAQRSSDAAREINTLISASEGHVKRGVDLVDQTGDALRGIFDRVSEISTQVGEIAVSAEEQSRGLAEINTAVNQLDQVTQQNAAMFEETTAASHALTSEAENLTNTMAQFKISRSSDAGAPKAPPARPKVNSASDAVKQVVNGGSVPAPSNDSWEDF